VAVPEVRRRQRSEEGRMSTDKKIIFLDVDGVMNGTQTASKGIMYQWHPGIEPEKVALLNQIIEQTGAEVVLSSTWRLHYKQVEMREYLKQQGFRGVMRDFTPDHSKTGRFDQRNCRVMRGDEVKAWLEEQKQRGRWNITHHVIFDDDTDFHPDQPWIHTDYMTGMMPAHVDIAVKILTEPVLNLLPSATNG
jgi:hypothetical protein